MKKLTPLFLFFLLVVASSCKKGTGTFTVTLEARQPFSAGDTVKFHDIYQERLEKLGIDADNIGLSFHENRIYVAITEYSKYQQEKFAERVRRALQSDARLSFWETYTVAEIAPSLRAAIDNDSTPGAQEGLFEKLHQVSGMDPGRSCELGICEVKDTAAVDAILAKYRSGLPADLRLAWSAPKEEGNGRFCHLLLLKSHNGKGCLDPHVTEAGMVIDNDSPAPKVEIVMDDESAAAWQRTTKANINRCIAIDVDGLVYSWPVVVSEIPGGKCQITGSFDKQEAEDLALLLQSQPLPESVNIVENNLKQ